MNMWVPHTIGNALLFSAAALFVLGMIFWLEFVRMARPVLTVFMAAAGAVCGYFLPLFWHTQLADLTLMIMGMVVGIILGAVLFRLTQALLFAAVGCLIVLIVVLNRLLWKRLQAWAADRFRLDY